VTAIHNSESHRSSFARYFADFIPFGQIDSRTGEDELAPAARAVDLSRLGTAQEAVSRLSPEQRQRVEAILPHAQGQDLERLKAAILEYDKHSTLWNSLKTTSTKALSAVFGGVGWIGAGLFSTYAKGLVSAVGLHLAGVGVGATVGVGASALIHYKVWKPRAERAFTAELDALAHLVPAQPAAVQPPVALAPSAAPSPAPSPSPSPAAVATQPARVLTGPPATTVVAARHTPSHATLSLLGETAGGASVTQ
jgi:hypothetical protein